MVFLLKFGVGGSQELRGGWSQLALLCALTMAGQRLDFREVGWGYRQLLEAHPRCWTVRGHLCCMQRFQGLQMKGLELSPRV